MKPSPLRRQTGTALGRAGEWIHYVAVIWLAFSAGGTGAVALYLIAATAPGVFMARGRLTALAAPAALVILASKSIALSVPVLVLLGGVAGIGAAAAGRPAAWTAGIRGAPGASGFAGAAVGMIMVASGAVRPALLVAASLLFLAWVLGEEHESRPSRPAVLVPATLGVAFVIGLRVLEPALFGRPAAAGLFAASWAAGVEVGWRASHRADARLILGAPFLVAGALAGAGAVQGPGLLFLYGGAGFGVGLIGGTGFPGEERARPRGWPLLIAAVTGSLWAMSQRDFASAVWGGAAVALVGGFVSSVLARRVPAPETAKAPGAEVAVEPIEESLESAVAELAQAIERARSIRREALTAFREASAVDALSQTRAHIRMLVDELSGKVNESREKLGALVA